MGIQKLLVSHHSIPLPLSALPYSPSVQSWTIALFSYLVNTTTSTTLIIASRLTHRSITDPCLGSVYDLSRYTAVHTFANHRQLKRIFCQSPGDTENHTTNLDTLLRRRTRSSKHIA